VAPHTGRGGWSWYTGSAAWLHRAAVETLLGLVVRGDRLSITPRVPVGWPGFEMTLRLGGRVLRLQHGDARTQGIAVAAGDWIDWRTLRSEDTAATPSADRPDTVWLSVSDDD
jgi:cyclic beta-1,2-glucan synthetase